MYIFTGGDIESQLQLRDELIYDLKQRMTLLTQDKDKAIFKLASENEQLRSQLDQDPIKEESTLAIQFVVCGLHHYCALRQQLKRSHLL